MTIDFSTSCFSYFNRKLPTSHKEENIIIIMSNINEIKK